MKAGSRAHVQAHGSPRLYFQHQRRRDISLVSFGVLFVVAVMGVIVERSSVGAL